MRPLSLAALTIATACLSCAGCLYVPVQSDKVSEGALPGPQLLEYLDTPGAQIDEVAVRLGTYPIVDYPDLRVRAFQWKQRAAFVYLYDGGGFADATHFLLVAYDEHGTVQGHQLSNDGIFGADARPWAAQLRQRLAAVTPPETRAPVFVYMPKKSQACQVSWRSYGPTFGDVRLDGERMGELGWQRYIVVRASEGAHTLDVGVPGWDRMRGAAESAEVVHDAPALSFAIQDGQPQYVRLCFHNLIAELQPVDAVQALAEMRLLKATYEDQRIE
jgi:hypothetical protein